mgnify:CR=1 FL=1
MSVKLKNRLKNYSFWVSLASAVLLLVQAVGKPLGLVINEEIYMSIVNSVLGVFVVLGIITHPAQNLINNMEKEEQMEQENQVKQENFVVEQEKVENETKSDCTDSQNADNVAKNYDVKPIYEVRREVLEGFAKIDANN